MFFRRYKNYIIIIIILAVLAAIIGFFMPSIASKVFLKLSSEKVKDLSVSDTNIWTEKFKNDKSIPHKLSVKNIDLGFAANNIRPVKFLNNILVSGNTDKEYILDKNGDIFLDVTGVNEDNYFYDDNSKLLLACFDNTRKQKGLRLYCIDSHKLKNPAKMKLPGSVWSICDCGPKILIGTGARRLFDMNIRSKTSYPYRIRRIPGAAASIVCHKDGYSVLCISENSIYNYNTKRDRNDSILIPKEFIKDKIYKSINDMGFISSNNREIYIFDINGKLAFKKIFLDNASRKYVLSKSGRYLAIVTYKEINNKKNVAVEVITDLYDISQNRHIWSKGSLFSSVNTINVSDSGEVLVYDGKKNISLFDFSDMKTNSVLDLKSGVKNIVNIDNITYILESNGDLVSLEFKR